MQIPATCRFPNSPTCHDARGLTEYHQGRSAYYNNFTIAREVSGQRDAVRNRRDIRQIQAALTQIKNNSIKSNSY
jgi:hypothetical protein